MQIVLGKGAIDRILGGEPDLVAPLHTAGVSAALIRRVVADPSGWQLAIPLVNPGGAPGSPVLVIVAPPA
jgi:hypothetical protein